MVILNVRNTHFECYYAFFRPLNIPESAKSMSWPQIYNRATRSPSGDAHTTHRMRKRRRRHVIMHAFQPLVRAQKARSIQSAPAFKLHAVGTSNMSMFVSN